MATKWTNLEADQARELFVAFCDIEEVAACMGVDMADMDTLCMQAFGRSAEGSRAHFSAVGRGTMNLTLYKQAVEEGNSKALDMVARKHLSMGPVELRTAQAAKTKKKLEL